MTCMHWFTTLSCVVHALRKSAIISRYLHQLHEYLLPVVTEHTIGYTKSGPFQYYHACSWEHFISATNMKNSTPVNGQLATAMFASGCNNIQKWAIALHGTMNVKNALD